ncbi:MAG: pyridoxamine 5'-phosphate oxidase family protein [Rhodospirillaceae bacterium]
MTMSMPNPWPQGGSPFHAGEQALQAILGVREQTEALGQRMIRDHLTEQHRTFLANLPLIQLAHVDAQGRPWATVLVGGAGFIHTPDPQTLILSAPLLPGDPLAASLRPGLALGMVGVLPGTRRRNRVNGRVQSVKPGRIVVRVEQSFGNCPQYIQTRIPVWQRDPQKPAPIAAAPIRQDGLSEADRAMIAEADSFFMATAGPDANEGSVIGGADASHRGGPPGFVRIDGNRLIIPDFPGNQHFNSLGNIAVNPKAGLLFSDDQSGDVLMVTGRAGLLWKPGSAPVHNNAQRAWELEVETSLRLPAALPFRWSFGEYSPQTLRAGGWIEETKTDEG